MKRVLVTGAKGFIGSWICRKYTTHNWDVIGVDRNETGDEEYKIIKCDLYNKDDVKNLVALLDPDLIIHCAGLADVALSVRQPILDYESNVTITYNVLEAMKVLHIDKRHLVFLSSAGVYGNPERLPIKEDANRNPLSPYALHKVMCEDLCSFYEKYNDYHIITVRVFSAYGRGLKKQIFWDLYKKYKDTGCLDLFGTGEESRDYIHVSDVVDGIYLLTENTDRGLYNIANGIEMTIREASECFANAMGIDKCKIRFNGNRREGDPQNWRADISKIETLGFKSKINMEAGIADYCKWLGEIGE